MSHTRNEKPLLVQSDGTLLLDTHAVAFDEARSSIAGFTELEKSPEHMHTYKITPLSLWNAISAGLTTETILHTLAHWSLYEVPENITFMIKDQASRFGKLTLLPYDQDNLFLQIDDPLIIQEINQNARLRKYVSLVQDGFILSIIHRGSIKIELLRMGYPIADRAPLREGAKLSFALREIQKQGDPFILRNYQKEAVKNFLGNNQPGTGFGTVVLACGAGKTVVGMYAMEQLKTNTLILTTNIAAVHQWISELLDKTTLSEDQIGEYTGVKKEIKPVTVATYQILVWRPDKESPFPHFSLFSKGDWGLIIYDEVHLLPAPIFRITAEIQAIRRLGLTATLVREDGAEADVFSLIGPKKYDIPWKELEQKGWIAKANCYEIRIDLPKELYVSYVMADKRAKFRIASENPEKEKLTRELIENHPDDSILVIGQYLDQLKRIAKALNAPLITGETNYIQREAYYNAFKKKKIHVLVVSRVANFAIDLPDASVAIQISGSFGSRQEEAQRLGRILRPKEKNSYYYTLVSHRTNEEDFAINRQKFLTEQGYKYQIEFWDIGEKSR